MPPGHWHSHVVGLTLPPVEVHASSVGHSHWQSALRNCGASQVVTHLPLHSTLPPGHWHSQLLALTVPPLPVHAWLAGHWQLQVLVFKTLGVVQVRHWLLQSVLPVGQPHILPFPWGFLMQLLEQHWVLAVHLRLRGLHAAQAAPGMEASVAPTSAAPTIRSALRLERVPLASPLARSSKEDASVASGLG